MNTPGLEIRWAPRQRAGSRFLIKAQSFCEPITIENHKGNMTTDNYTPAILIGPDTLHPNTNTTVAENLARLAYARECIHTTRTSPRWEKLSHENKQARQDAACAILDEVYFVARHDIEPSKLFRLLTKDATMDATVSRHEAAAF